MGKGKVMYQGGEPQHLAATPLQLPERVQTETNCFQKRAMTTPFLETHAAAMQSVLM